MDLRSLVVKSNLTIDKAYLSECISIIKDIGDEMNKSSNLKCDMTSYDSLVEHESFQKIRDIILDRVSEYHLFSGVPKELFHISSMWGAYYDIGEEAVEHQHLPNLLSFCLYLNVDENSSPIIFRDVDDEYVIQPDIGDIVIFPSWLLHSVPKHNEKTNRVVISGNLEILFETQMGYNISISGMQTMPKNFFFS